MGKIFNALRRAEGEIPDGGSRSSGKEQDAGNRAAGQAPAPEAPPAGRVRTVSLLVSDLTPLLSAGRLDYAAAEQYRILRTRLIQHPKAPALVVISSPGMGEGKTVTAVNLAGALALRSEEKVLLLDADLRRSATSVYLGIHRKPGLAEVLASDCRLEDALLQAEQRSNFYLLPAGDPSANPAELFDSPHWPALTGHLRRQFRHVIIDSPPVEAVADYDLISAACDGVILVVRPDHTHRRACAGALKKVGEKLLGVVLNGADEWFLWKWPTSYDYSYGRKGRK